MCISHKWYCDLSWLIVCNSVLSWLTGVLLALYFFVIICAQKVQKCLSASEKSLFNNWLAVCNWIQKAISNKNLSPQLLCMFNVLTCQCSRHSHTGQYFCLIPCEKWNMLQLRSFVVMNKVNNRTLCSF